MWMIQRFVRHSSMSEATCKTGFWPEYAKHQEVQHSVDKRARCTENRPATPDGREHRLPHLHNGF